MSLMRVIDNGDEFTVRADQGSHLVVFCTLCKNHDDIWTLAGVDAENGISVSELIQAAGEHMEICHTGVK